jgi:hypothetical protein
MTLRRRAAKPDRRQPLPEFADVIVIVENHLKGLRITEAQELDGRWPGEDIRRSHIQRINFERVKNRRGQSDEVAIRMTFHFRLEMRVVFRTAILSRKIRLCEVVDQKKPAAVEYSRRFLIWRSTR